ncbi:hypothetical protein [Mycolicibacter heraklionensis]|nr:hypothetical protein [Mycolicibacter heraklionensis]
MNSDPKYVRVRELSDAEKFRLHQASELMRAAGFVELPNGAWRPPSPDA